MAGCGVISRFHLDAIRSIEDAALCGVYDPVEASARAAAQAYGTRAYPDYDALLADPQVDAVCICTPSHLHAPLALQAVAAGMLVLIEKPVALTLEDCDAVAAAARAAGVQVGVVSQLRYGPAVGGGKPPRGGGGVAGGAARREQATPPMRLPIPLCAFPEERVGNAIILIMRLF